MGDGVNIAARLEGVAEPNGLCLSGAAYEQVRDKLKHEFIDVGEKELKNIARPVRVYRLAALDRGEAAGGASTLELRTTRLALSRKALNRCAGVPEHERRPPSRNISPTASLTTSSPG
jgi:adenylate cyclase